MTTLPVQAGTGDAGMDARIEEQRRRLLAVPEISRVIQTGDQSQLIGLLNTLGGIGPK